jgi:hypothetical protein
MWQDWVIAACQWGFALALLPTLFGHRKPEVSTAVVTGILAAVVAFTLFTLPLVWAAIATGSTSVIWLIIAVQAWRRRQVRGPGSIQSKAA